MGIARTWYALLIYDGNIIRIRVRTIGLVILNYIADTVLHRKELRVVCSHVCLLSCACANTHASPFYLAFIFLALKISCIYFYKIYYLNTANYMKLDRYSELI